MRRQMTHRMLPLVTALAASCFGLASCGDGANKRGDSDVDVQSATDAIARKLEQNRKSLPKGAPTDAPIARTSIEGLVRRYQPPGFFVGERPAAAAARLRRAYRKAYQAPAKPPKTRLDELDLIGADGRQAWYSDIERDVINGNREYVRAMREWGRASRGAFNPTKISERWRSEEGPVDIRFTSGGKRWNATARGLGDFLDLCALTRDVNKAIAKTGRQFELYRPDEALAQVAFAAAVTTSEKRRLEEMGWTFATPAEVGLAFGYGQLYEQGEPTGCAA